MSLPPSIEGDFNLVVEHLLFFVALSEHWALDHIILPNCDWIINIFRISKVLAFVRTIQARGRDA